MESKILKKESEMKHIILHFSIKYRANWEDVYASIKSKEFVTPEEIKDVKLKHGNDFISIIDSNYPNNFKDIYMPPLGIFFKGNKDLLAYDESICAVWIEDNYIQILDNKLDKNKVYTLFFKTSEINNIQKLLANGYKLILVDNYEINNKSNEIDYTNNNVVFISETCDEITNPNIGKEQILQRILLGSAKDQLTFSTSLEYCSKYLYLFKFEGQKLQVIGKINDKLIDSPLIISFKKSN